LRETETVHGPRHVDVTEENIDGKVLVPKDEDSLVGVGRLDNPVAAVAQVPRFDETEQNFVFDDEYRSRAWGGFRGFWAHGRTAATTSFTKPGSFTRLLNNRDST
jgi:hypothetical protein